MIGNSSSGIIEAPSFKLPVVNIGDRQKGRVMPPNVICAGYAVCSIIDAIETARSVRFRNTLTHMKNPFGDGFTGRRIARVLAHADLTQVRKGFYDLVP
jgi:UDP-N-acetylglucosamine 2-epimerase